MDEAMDRLLKTQHHLLNSSRYQLKKGCPSKFVEVGLGPATSLNPAVRISSGKHVVYVSPEDWLELLHSEDSVMNYFVESGGGGDVAEPMYFKDFHVKFVTLESNSAKVVWIKCRTLEVCLEYEMVKSLFDCGALINLKLDLLTMQRFKDYVADIRSLIEASSTLEDFLARLVAQPSDVNKLSMMEYVAYYRNSELFSKFNTTKDGDTNS